jgi:hypothetical protein
MSSGSPHPESGPAVSSPVSTGGRGTHFEQLVNAYWLAQLLVGGIPPIVTKGRVAVVHFQTERLGWNTDDFLVEVDVGLGPVRRMAGQVKLSFTVSAADEECSKAITDFWKDYKNPSIFDRTRDCFVLVVQRGSKVLLDHLGGLLDAARAANSAEDFAARLERKGLVHATVRKYHEEIKTIVAATAGPRPPAADIWEFVRTIHLLALDLGTSTAHAESSARSILALTARSPDQVSAAAASWNSLVVLASGAMPQAATFQREDLPSDLVALHEAIGAGARDAVTALEQHSAVVHNGICTTLGSSLHLPRPELSAAVHQGLVRARVVLISGPSGSGKSAVAADCIASAKGTFCFSFRAEEFANAHLDDSLQRAQIPANAETLRALMAGQGRVLFHIESVERLLEASQRNAFADLLALVTSEPNWQLVLTCRDYSLDLVRSAFLAPKDLEHHVVEVPPLDEASLTMASTTYEGLKVPLDDPALKALLTNPYYLNAALRIDWSAGANLPAGAREFRSRFWRDVVRMDQDRAAGMPHRRHQAFVEVAVRRARELRAWVPCGDLDQEALSALQRESLVVQSTANPALWAPAHDVLEDWAILTALDEDYAAHEDSVRGMALIVDGYPALRRTLRRWIAEFQLQGDGGDRAFEMAVAGDGLAPWLRDDILAALLGSEGAGDLLSRRGAALFRDECALLTRIIHLIRVACVRTPAWADGLNYAVLEPTGTSWAALAEIVAANVQRLSAKQMPQVLGFVEDWAKGVSIWRPHPPGEAAVVTIAHVLADHFDSYNTRDQQRRALSVIAKCPSADTAGLRRLLGLGENPADQDRDAAIRSREFREQVLTGLDGNLIAMQQPDVVIEACRSFFLLGEQDEDEERYRGYLLELEHIFGLDSVTNHAFFPASAYHGPYLALLRWHRQKGLEFVVDIVNHCYDSYVADRPGDRLEPTVEVITTRPDGVCVEYHANQRFYELYRGTMTVGPEWLQTLLMAMELALFELADTNSANLDAWLLWLLSKTNCAAVAGVVASVAVAHPRSAPKTILTLITCREYVMLDRVRMAKESRSLSAVFDTFPNADRQLFVDERKKSDQLPHRKHDLEWAALLLQLGPEAPQVQAILDAHLAALPPLDAQSQEDKSWRFALHRMDLRKYTPEVRSAHGGEPAEAAGSDRKEGDAAIAEAESSADPSSGAVIALVPNELDTDLAEMSRKTGIEMAEVGDRMGLWMWGQKAYERNSDVDPSEWRQRLQQASTQKPNSWPMLGESGPAFVAAVCVRDHWSELDETQRSWCVEVVSSIVEAGDEDWSERGQASQGMMDGGGACANALAFILAQEYGSQPASRAASAFSVALTHPSRWMRWHAARAVAEHPTAQGREVVWHCVNAVAFHGTLTQERLGHGSRRMEGEEEWERMQRAVAVEVRGRFLRSLETVAAGQSADGGSRQGFNTENNLVSRVPASGIATKMWGPIRRWFVSRCQVEDPSISPSPLPSADQPTLPADAFGSMDLSTWHGADAAALSLAMLARSGADQDAVAAHARLASTLVAWWDQEAKDRHSDPGHRRSHETVLELTKLIARYAHGCAPSDAEEVLAPILSAVDTHPDKAEDVLQEVIFEEDRVRSATNFWHIWRLFAARMESAAWLPRMDDRYSSANSLVRAVFLCSWWKDDARHWTPLEGHAHLLGELLLRLPTSPLALESYVRFLYRVGRRSIPTAFVTVAEYVKRDPASVLSVSNTVFMLEVVLREWVYGHPAELKRDPRLRESVLSLLDGLVEAGSSASFRMRDDFVTPLREG